MIKITIQQDEDSGSVREFTTTLNGDCVTWFMILENTIDMCRGLTYLLPETGAIMSAIESVSDAAWKDRRL